MHARSRRWVATVLVVALVATMAGIIPASATPKAPGNARAVTRPPAALKVTTGSDRIAATKLDARLREAVDAAEGDAAKGEAEIDVAVLVEKGAPRPAGMTRALRMNLRGDPNGEMYVGTAKVSKLVKIASGKGVTFLYDNGRRTAPIVPDSGGGGLKRSAIETRASAARTKARTIAARAAGSNKAFREQFDDDGVLIEAVGPIDYEGGAATGWHDVSEAGHNSVGAWDLGYTGTGVKIAVADDSADFAHPDLMDTQAVVDDPTSAYDGWPMALDPFSALLYAYDQFYGDSYVADGDTWFSDTSATIDGLGGEWDGKLITTSNSSLSGTYHIGYLWDENYYNYGYGDFPLVLVADENTAGVYDTVYVDLDYDWDFTFDKPCTMASPISYADLWDVNYDFNPDGYADISGGMIYWIADGQNQPPGVDFMFAEEDVDVMATPGSGELVCFMGALNVDEDHGTLCSSNVVGQGVIDAPSIWGDYPEWRTPTPGTDGIVQGAARDGELVAIADIYWNHFTSTLTAYDFAALGHDEAPGTGDEIQVVSNSYGESDDDGDGWDYRSRYITFLNTYLNDRVSYLFSTGNGAPGYGTNAPPSASTAIAVGASTQMGAVGGWDSAYDEDQITVGDVIPWSNRGPDASGGLAPDIVADGAYSSGAVPVNMYFYEGSTSWDIWGGTSRSCPVAAGNLALVYQAYADANGTWPTYEQAKQFLHNGARDLNYDTLVQGAGSIDAGRSAALAAEVGGLSVSPSSWTPGDVDGETYESFAQVVHPGDVFHGSFLITNHGADPVTVTGSDAWYMRSGTETLDITLDSALEDPYDFNRPDHLTEITSLIPADTDLMVIRTYEDSADFAPTGEFSTSAEHNVARVVVYDWKDQDASGDLWTDASGDGFVDAGEIDEGEFMRFTYHNNFANTHEARVQTPLDRMHDGVFLGLQHNRRAGTDPTTVVHVEISFWDRADMPWLVNTGFSTLLGAGGNMGFSPELEVPADAPPGIYEGQIRLTDGTNVTVVPVVFNVAADDYAFRFGNGTGTPDALMPNDTVFGAQDWQWRAESGDWRFFWTDGTAAGALPTGASWLVHTAWQDRGAPAGFDTDLDTQLYGPALDDFSFLFPETYGPYGLARTGGSANTNIGAGIWTFQTNSGTTDEWVTGPLEPGLNQVMIHNVLYDGKGLGQTFSGETGVIAVDPQSLYMLTPDPSGTEQVDFTTYDLDLTGANAQAYGLTKRVEEVHDITQGATWWDEYQLADAAYLDVSTVCPSSDIDLYVYYSDDDWATYSLVGASESSGGDERVRIDMPPNGSYEIDVYGYSVSGTQPFQVTVSSPMGDDITLSGLPAGAVPAGGGFTLDADWTKVRADLADREGDYEGVIFLGPTEAPSAVQVPVTLHYPFEVESANPAADAVVADENTDIEITLTKRADPTTVGGTTVYLMDGTTEVPCQVAYDDLTAKITLTPDEPLLHRTTYDVFLEDIDSNDGDVLNDTWSFDVDIPLVTARVAGDNRVQTAVKASQEAFAAGSAEYVVVATSLNWPDALGGSALAGALKSPILLTPATSLPAEVAAEIGRLGATKAVILGGASAVGTPVEAALKSTLGAANVERIAGTNRYETARKVAARTVDELGPGYDGTAFLATGANFPDALGASPLAAANGWPIYLVNPVSGADAALVGAMKADGVTDALVLGGATVVSSRVETDVKSKVPCDTVRRLSGANRYATACAVATYGVDFGGLSWDWLAITTGQNFPDALAGGVLQGMNGSVMLLTPGANLDDQVAGILATNSDTIRNVYFLGGESAVSPAVVTEVTNILQ